MRRNKIKHLGKNKKFKTKINLLLKKTLIILFVILSTILIYNISKEVKEYISKKSKYEISLEKSKFIEEVKDGAMYNYNKYGILPSITVSQAILESGWGKSKLSKESNNLFGIKADNSWDGEAVEAITSENYDDTIKAKFRKYKSITDSIKDHGKFLSENKRYRENGLFDSKNYEKQAQALEDAGYSTKADKNGKLIYADMLIEIIEKYNLTKLDFK